MIDCINEFGFVVDVFLHLLPTLTVWFGFTYILRFASDWF